MKEAHSLILDINRYINGDDTAGDRLCKTFASPVKSTVIKLLGSDDSDIDDVVQESLLAMLGYLRRAAKAPENPTAFVVTIARNRCFNLKLWRRRRIAQDVQDLEWKLMHVAANPLDLLDEEERKALLCRVLTKLDTRCRNLLIAIYKQETSMETLRRNLGLGSVQAVYHRRNICLKKAQKFLNRQLLNCHDSGKRKSRFPGITCPEEESDDG
jgi:RNA polymerase sigma factor (sigma-70 family)